MSRIISLCGNIGCGKSTLISNLNQNQYAYDVVQEPVSEMNDLLQNFYSDMNKWAFHLQCKVLLLYHDMLKRFSHNKSYIVERSPLESKYIFAQNLLESRNLSKIEHELYSDIYSHLSWEPDLIIYIQTDPDICLERIKSRSRECEDNISMEYVQSLHNLYERFYEKHKYSKNIIVIDGSKSSAEVYESCKKIINII